MFPPRPSKSFQPLTVNDLTLVKTRYSASGFFDVFNTVLIPFISDKDTLLIFRVFSYTHIRKVNKTDNKLGIIHIPENVTIQQMKSGPLGIASPNLQKRVAKWITDKCTYCIIHNDLGRNFPHSLGDPRILSLFGQDPV